MTFAEKNAAVQHAQLNSLPIGKNEPINVHDVFVVWFVWGFWNAMIPLLMIPITIITFIFC